MQRRTHRFLFAAQLGFTLLVCGFLITPAVMSMLAGVTENYFLGLSSGLTLRWLHEVFRLYSDTMVLSLQLAFACLGLTLILGVPCAYALARRPGRLSRAFEELLTLPVAIPGLAIALALILAYGSVGGLRQSWLFILIGHTLFCLPFMVSAIQGVLPSIGFRALEESASSLGASPWRAFRDIIVPNLRPGILAGSLMVVTLSLGEFNLTWMLHTPLTKTLPVGLADSYASMRLEIASAYTVVFFLMLIPILVAMQMLANRQRNRSSGPVAEARSPAPLGTTRPNSTAEAKGAAVRLQNCGKVHADGTRALHPLDLQIGAGETLVLLGPSGCGKTTTLRLIAGLDQPDPGGRIEFDGEDVTALPAQQRQIGIVFQSYALFPNMDVAQNVGYGLRIRRLPRAEREQRVHEMLSLMRIEELAHRRIDQLSGGQSQRVALARALAPYPRVLLLDEPLAALDAALRDHLRTELSTLLRELGITAIYVTHDQAEAMALGDRIAVLDRGRIAQIGTPREVYFRPDNAVVADFVGIMNRVRGVVERERLAVAGGSIAVPDWTDGDYEVRVRPEAFTIEPPTSAPIVGTIRDVIFLGERQRVVVAGVTDELILVETNNHYTLRIGERLGLSVAAEHLLDSEKFTESR